MINIKHLETESFFIGRGQNKIDLKGRVIIPSQFNLKEAIIFYRHFEALQLFELNIFRRYLASIQEDQERIEQIMHSLFGEATPDGQKRILIPKKCRPNTMSGSAIFIGNCDRINMFFTEKDIVNYEERIYRKKRR